MTPNDHKLLLENKPVPLCVLSRLGVSEDDIRTGKILAAEIPPLGPWETLTKEEKLLGYTTSRLKREKALKILGVTEDEIEYENRKRLGSLGNTTSPTTNKDRKRRLLTFWSFEIRKMMLIRGNRSTRCAPVAHDGKESLVPTVI
eukprot:scaffold101295_cov58-Attheya_sp.AAC.6